MGRVIKVVSPKVTPHLGTELAFFGEGVLDSKWLSGSRESLLLVNAIGCDSGGDNVGSSPSVWIVWLFSFLEEEDVTSFWQPRGLQGLFRELELCSEQSTEIININIAGKISNVPSLSVIKLDMVANENSPTKTHKIVS